MITERRVFQAKVGQASAVVALVKEAQGMFGGGLGPASRIYTDYMSGRTDRVAWEMDVESLGELERQMAAETDPAQQPEFERWFARLSELIEGATVEHWRRED